MTPASQTQPRESNSAASSDTKALEDLVAQAILAWRTASATSSGPSTREFLNHHPEVERHRSLLLDLAVEEYCLRRDRGETLDPTTFAAQFPTIGESLGQVLGFYLHNLSDFDVPDVVPTEIWPQTGEVVSGFLLLQRFDRGGIARVYLASELDIGQRLVVIRVARGISRDARTLGKLTHPNLVPLLSIHTVEYIDPISRQITTLTLTVMPFLGSTTLSDVLARTWQMNLRPKTSCEIRRVAQEGCLGEEVLDVFFKAKDSCSYPDYTSAAVALVAQIADGLNHAHENNIDHRAIKPSNVLLTPTCIPLLMDSASTSSAGYELSSEFAETLRYMAPECLEQLAVPSQSIGHHSFVKASVSGKPGAHARRVDQDRPRVSTLNELPYSRPTSVDGRICGRATTESSKLADVFSLAALLYDLLTGAPPYGMCDPRTPLFRQAREFYIRQHTSPVSRNSANSHLDEDLFHLVDTCLSPIANQRPSSAAVMAAELRGYLDRRDEAEQSSVKRRHRNIFASCGVLLLAFIAIIGGYAFKARHSDAHYADGIREYDSERFHTAIEHFTLAISKCNDDISRNASTGKGAARQLQLRSAFYFARGQAFRRLGMISEAEIDFEKAIAYDRSPRIAACLAFIKGILGNDRHAAAIYAMALMDIKAADQISVVNVSLTDRVAILNNIGYHQARKGQFSTSLAYFDEAGAVSEGVYSEVIFRNRTNALLKLVQLAINDTEVLREPEKLAVNYSRTSRDPGAFLLLAARIASCRYQRHHRREDELAAVAYILAAIDKGTSIGEIIGDPELEQHVGDLSPWASGDDGDVPTPLHALIEPSVSAMVADAKDR